MKDSEGQGRLLEGQETMSTEQGTMSTTKEPGCGGDRNNYGNRQEKPVFRICVQVDTNQPAAHIQLDRFSG